MKIDHPCANLDRKNLKVALERALPDYKVRLAPGRISISRSRFCGVEVYVRKDFIKINPSFMPSATALWMFGAGCALGVIPGLLIGMPVQNRGKELVDPVAHAIKQLRGRGIG